MLLWIIKVDAMHSVGIEEGIARFDDTVVKVFAGPSEGNDGGEVKFIDDHAQDFCGQGRDERRCCHDGFDDC